MNESILNCKDEQRRSLIRLSHLNGLDYLEVSDDQLSLFVYFIGALPENISKENIRIEGGQRIRNIQVVEVESVIQEPNLDSYLRVFVDKYGDFSTYTLRLVGLDNIDPRYSYLQFSFKVGCPSDLDCQSEHICPAQELAEPEINYLAKDDASFRQLILDRLALVMPEWQSREVPDFGITLVELLAYVGDYLSYYQDAVATEAYLDTARLRISVRRHVRLIDYPMHEGCNSRTWVWLETDNDNLIKLKDIYFITKYLKNAPVSSTVLTVDDLINIPVNNYQVFEPVSDSTLESIQIYKAHNEIYLYTWGNRQCCLAKGATTGTLLDEWIPPASPPVDPSDSCDNNPKSPPTVQLERRLKLKPGDILIFEEVKNPKTGNLAGADITHRHVVRLVKVEQNVDEAYQLDITNVAQKMPTPIVEITWAVEDALPFSLCISAVGLAPECKYIDNISVARGNVLLVDHGRTLIPEDLGTVATKSIDIVCEGENQPVDTAILPARFYPPFKHKFLTYRQPLSTQDLLEAPASRLLIQNPRLAVPQIIKLIGIPANYSEPIDLNNLPENPDWEWTPAPRGDLLASNPTDKHFVVEIDNEGYAHLRFALGEGQPEVGMHFFATYRVSESTNGSNNLGNIGANTITYIVFRNKQSGIRIKPSNPLQAKGGTPAEPLSEVKLFAPHNFRKELQRAITAQDYADIVMRDFANKVQRAAATLRWTGSWYEVLVAIDLFGTETDNPKLLNVIAQHLHRYRRIGHDVVVKQAIYVPLDIAMTICVKPDYLRGHVKADLLNVFSNRILPDGRRGFFHPDNLTFGTGIAFSQLVAKAQMVPGVENVIVTRLRRLWQGDNGELDNGVLSLSPLEIAQLDNDPNFPENGKFQLDVRGVR